jgi:hypothetical protein
MDPGAYCSDLLAKDIPGQARKLSIIVKGDVVKEERVTKFAKSYLGSDFATF